LEIVLISAQDRGMVCAEHTIGGWRGTCNRLENHFEQAMELLGQMG
jgi:hypothetical protein